MRRDRTREASWPLDDHARLRFGYWIANEPEVSRLMVRLECRHWMDDVRYSLDGQALAAVKAEVIRRVEAAGGRLEVGVLVLTVSGGVLAISLK